MVCLDIPQGRALAIILPSVTFVAHAATLFLLRALFADTSSMSCFAWYDVVAMVASALGIYGAIKRRSPLVTFYTLTHALVLTTLCLILAVNILPASFPATFPVLTYMRYDSGPEQWMCHEWDDGFGWDDHWFEQCRESVRVLMKGSAWMASVLMTAQWWALVEVSRWNAALRERRRERRGDIERCVGQSEKMEL